MKTKSRFAGWMYKNRDRGIPNLMLWIAIGNLLVYVMTRISTNGYLILNLLSFDPLLILQGQVWRLVSFVFTYLTECGLFLGALSLLCYYWFGRILEQYWGSLRFTIYYFSGVLISAAFALLLQGAAMLTGAAFLPIALSATYLNLSLFLAVATIQPDAQVRVWFILPLKMKWVAWIDIGFTVYELIRGIIAMIFCLKLGLISLYWMVPIIALLNYFIFFGSQVSNLLPDRLRYRHSRPKKVRPEHTKANPNWAAGYRSSTGQRPYRFKCTVCGRTDTDNPGLEFRYCSRCAGYRCYCIDHINNHAHIVE